MKKNLTFLILFFIAFSLKATIPEVALDMKGTVTANALQTDPPAIVITEFMYNNPGTDSLEFIELFNNGDEAVNLNGYSFREGVSFTFPDVLMQVGDYLVVAIDSLAFENVFGVAAFQWIEGGLRNTGEAIVLVDNLGQTVDSVDYDVSAPWDDTADGGGPSLELCDLDGDNALAENWRASSTKTNVFLGDSEVLATPGLPNNCIETGYPAYSIGAVTTTDANGRVDSLGVTCQLQGLVYGTNLQPGGLQFTLIDSANDGIGVFEGNTDYGYQLEEGDEVVIQGAITQFRGLTQIDPDTVYALSRGNALVAPTIVTALGEETESQLIRLENVSVVTPSQWNPGGSGFDVDLTDGPNTYSMRIDADLDVFNEADPPGGIFTLTGIGRQFDSSEPFDEGYQIMPRYISDFNPYNAVEAEIPLYPIGTITTNNEFGEPDSLDVLCRIRGVAHSINFRPGGLDVHIIDGNGDGIVIFSSNEDFGYTPNLGDEVLAQGTVDFFSGLTELALDTVSLLSSGNALFEPTVVTELNESTEAQLIKLENVRIVDASQWTSSGSGFNVDITDGTNNYVMRIDADVDLYNGDAPEGIFNLIGMGAQFDRDLPYDDGYQILPRFAADIDLVNAVYDARLGEQLNIFPNPLSEHLIIQTGIFFEEIRLSDFLGQGLKSWRNIAPGTHRWSLAALPSGAYVLHFSADGRFWATKFIKE